MIPVYRHPVVEATKRLCELPKYVYMPNDSDYYKHYAFGKIFDYASDGMIAIPGYLSPGYGLVMFAGEKPVIIHTPIGIHDAMRRGAYAIGSVSRLEVIKQLKRACYLCRLDNQARIVEAYFDRLLEEEATHRNRERKAKTIQEHWRRAISDPHMLICRNRLRREASERIFL